MLGLRLRWTTRNQWLSIPRILFFAELGGALTEGSVTPFVFPVCLSFLIINRDSPTETVLFHLPHKKSHCIPCSVKKIPLYHSAEITLSRATHADWMEMWPYVFLWNLAVTSSHGELSVNPQICFFSPWLKDWLSWLFACVRKVAARVHSSAYRPWASSKRMSDIGNSSFRQAENSLILMSSPSWLVTPIFLSHLLHINGHWRKWNSANVHLRWF